MPKNNLNDVQMKVQITHNLKLIQGWSFFIEFRFPLLFSTEMLSSSSTCPLATLFQWPTRMPWTRLTPQEQSAQEMWSTTWPWDTVQANILITKVIFSLFRLHTVIVNCRLIYFTRWIKIRKALLLNKDLVFCFWFILTHQNRLPVVNSHY